MTENTITKNEPKKQHWLIKVILFPYRVLVVIIGTGILIYFAYRVVWTLFVKLILYTYNLL